MINFEEIDKKIINILSDFISLPIYHIIKLQDDIEEFIVFNYSIDENNWSNDKADDYIIDISILISAKDIKTLLKNVRSIEKNTIFKRILSGQNIDTQNWEFILYGCFVINGDNYEF